MPTITLNSNASLRRYDDIRELIANPANPTPLVKLNHVAPVAPSQLYLKLEWFDPFGSIKDRTAFYLLKGLEQRGQLDGKAIVEPSSGNTGIALAALAALSGKKLTVTIPDGVPDEKKLLLRMLGAEVWATPDDLCPIDHPKDGAIALAHSFVTGAATRPLCDAESIREPRQHRGAFRDDRAGDLEPDRRPRGLLLRRLRHLRDDHRRGPLLEATESQDSDHRRGTSEGTPDSGAEEFQGSQAARDSRPQRHRPRHRRE